MGFFTDDECQCSETWTCGPCYDLNWEESEIKRKRSILYSNRKSYESRKNPVSDKNELLIYNCVIIAYTLLLLIIGIIRYINGK